MKFFSFFQKIDFWVLFPLVFLSFLGLLTIYSIGFSKNNLLNFKKQIVFFLIGFSLMIVLSFFDWEIFKKKSLLFLFFYFLSLALIFYLLIFGSKIRGAKIWYRFGPFSFDPSEILKISLIFIFASFFSKKHIELYDLKSIFFSLLFLILPGLFLSMQPNLGAFLVLIFIWFSILLVSGIRQREFLILIFLGLLFLIFLWSKILLPYQKERIIGFLFPQLSDPLKINWSQRQAKIAIGSAGFWGKGIFEGEQKKLGFLTDPETDFIFSVLVEETGFLGAFLTFNLFLILIFRILKISFSQRSNFTKLFGVGIASQIFIYFFLNLSTNIGLLPVVGIPLPFLS
ncbi:MAG: FtsW/RodA/SpoVE family cell cycle protein, partial [Minisyncoccales bacterium]